METFDNLLDKKYGVIGTPRRDKHELKLKNLIKQADLFYEICSKCNELDLTLNIQYDNFTPKQLEAIKVLRRVKFTKIED